MYPTATNVKRAHSHRLRAGRHARPGQIYLITTVCVQRRHFFDSMPAGRDVISSLRSTQGSAATLAFVVMPDHLHWLMQLTGGHALSEVVHFVKSDATKRLNHRLGRNGSIWQKGFYDSALRDEAEIRECARYIIANPLRAGLVDSIGDYPLWDAVWI